MPWRSQPDTDGIVFDVEGAPAPLYRDPMYDGTADPSIISNIETEEWWILYTQRRANQRVPAKSWAHGTAIGVASSDDAGRTWRYRGTLNLNIESGHNTFWAPDILHYDGTYHLNITYIQGVPDAFYGDREIAHYTSETLWNWTFESFLSLSSRSIDPDVHQLNDGTWRLWFKDSGNIYAADSRDLYEWTLGSREFPDIYGSDILTATSITKNEFKDSRNYHRNITLGNYINNQMSNYNKNVM